MLLWKKQHAQPDARIAIAGDFLPPVPSASRPLICDWKRTGLNLAKYIGEVDAAILNLECCVDTGPCRPYPKLGLGDNFTAPRDVLDFPAALGAGIIGVANNHTFDYGPQGFERALGAIRQAGLIPIGVTRSLLEAPTVAVTKLPSGQAVGFWAAARHLSELATRGKSGIEPASVARGKAALAALRNLHADVNIALLHAGMEHTNRPDPFDVALIDELAKAGFDVVAASHSHRLSGYKRLDRPNHRPAFCFYGLGSVCSSVLYSPLEREGVIVVIGTEKSGEIAEVCLKFVHLDENGFGTAPTTSIDAEMRDRFTRLSEEIRLGTYEKHFYRDVRSGLLRRQFRDIRTAFRRGGVNGLARKLTRIRMRHLKRAVHATIG